MRKIVSILFALALVLLMPVSTYAAITNVTNTPADTTAGATTTDNVTFTTGLALAVLAPADQIIITFPAGFDASGATVNNTATTTPSGSDPILSTATATVVTCNVTANEAAGAFSIVLTGIVNHQTAGAYTVNVETQDGVGGIIEPAVASAFFNITAGPANQLVITQQPAGSVSGVALVTQPIVEARDQFGNVNTTYAVNVVASENETGTLTGTLSVAPLLGVATFTDLVFTATVDLEIFQIDFTSGALTPATSANVTCNVVATQLVITTQPPVGSTSGAPIPGPIVVEARDAGNVTDIDYVTNVVASENETGTLTGITTVAPAAGVATFNNLIYTATVDLETFQVDFTSGVLAGATSNNVVCAIPGGGGGAGGGGMPPASERGSMSLALYLNWEGRAITNINLTSTNGLVTIGIPSGTVLLDAQSNPLGNIQIVTLSTPPPPPGYVLVGHAYDCLPAGATFQPAITLTFKYTEADIPDGVSEEDLVIAYWDGDQWVNLTTAVKVATNTATAEVAHFTPFAILAYTGAPAFATSDLSITPAEVDIGKEVTISVLVANTGDGAGSYEVTLEIDNVVVTTKAVTLAAGASEGVTFTTAKSAAGNYAVSVGGLSGTFTVKEEAPPLGEAPPEAEESKPLTPWIVVGIVAAVIVVVLVAIMLGRRRA